MGGGGDSDQTNACYYIQQAFTVPLYKFRIRMNQKKIIIFQRL